MFKTLTGKFTFLFWIIFFFIVTPLYLLAHIYFKELVIAQERQKIEYLFEGIEPLLAFYLSFEQEKNIQTRLDELFDTYDLQEITLTDANKKIIYHRKKPQVQQSFVYTSTLKDPFSNNSFATMSVLYSNENLHKLQQEILYILLLVFFFAFLIFLTGLLLIRHDLSLLKKIANAFVDYSYTKKPVTIDAHKATKEVKTIVNRANEMMSTTSRYLQELESFNKELEQRVEKELQKQRKQEKLMLHQSRQAAMGEMLESIAHQWRQPLNVIGIASADLTIKYNLKQLSDAEFHQKMTEITDNINYMSDTIDDFRNFLHPQRQESYFNPARSIEAVQKILQAQIQNSNIRCKLDMEQDIVLYGVENEFKQVIIILLNNAMDAIKAQRHNDPQKLGVVNISLSSSFESAILKICDNGEGIADDIIDKIFDAYFSTKSKVSGTGIGLYMVKNII
ncbi:MAG: HAMP domain-containing sensor histidine kinase, partial [Sulfurimonas sp.]